MSVIHLSDWLLVMGPVCFCQINQISNLNCRRAIFWEQETHLLKNVEVV